MSGPLALDCLLPAPQCPDEVRAATVFFRNLLHPERRPVWGYQLPAPQCRAKSRFSSLCTRWNSRHQTLISGSGPRRRFFMSSLPSVNWMIRCHDASRRSFNSCNRSVWPAGPIVLWEVLHERLEHGRARKQSEQGFSKSDVRRAIPCPHDRPADLFKRRRTPIQVRAEAPSQVTMSSLDLPIALRVMGSRPRLPDAEGGEML